MSTSLFNEALISTFYRLIHLLSLDGPLSETLRIGMLAFGVSIFLASNLAKQPYASLIERYRNCLLELRANSTKTPPSLLLWLLLLWEILIPVELDWLEDIIIGSQIRSWGEARRIVKSIMWVDFMHDAPGKKVFENWVITL